MRAIKKKLHRTAAKGNHPYAVMRQRRQGAGEQEEDEEDDGTLWSRCWISWSSGSLLDCAQDQREPSIIDRLPSYRAGTPIAPAGTPGSAP